MTPARLACPARPFWRLDAAAAACYLAGMSQKRPLVIVTRKLPEPVQARLMELFDARLNLDDRPMSADQLKAAMASAEIVVPTVTDQIGRAHV